MYAAIFLMGQPAGGGQGGGFLSFLPFILIMAIIYFLMIRPQVRKQKQKQQMIQGLRKGDRILTAGGVYGTIEGIQEKDETITVKIADSVKVQMTKGSVSSVVQPKK